MKRILAVCLLLALAVAAVAQEKGTVLVKNGTLVTSTDGEKANADLLIVDGVIKEIGQNLSAPRGAKVVDASGKYVMAGIIDTHSHLAVHGSVNEWTNPVTAEVRIEDVIDETDVGIYRALAGGVTTAHIMHGSANVIGGQGETIKFRYGNSAEALKLKNAPRTIKFALGENPTRVHGIGNSTQPRTRMGVEQIIRETFDAALDYKRNRNAYLVEKATYEKARKKDRLTPPVPVAKNERMEVISDILSGEILVHCHSYRADEILMLMRVFNDYGIKDYTFQHVLEGFKVAPELVKNGAYASTFADWWAYKFEVYYATPYNAAIMNKYGVTTSINSDSGELIRHLNHEAAKTVKYGGVSKEDAIKMITINPAIQLGIDKRTGSLEVGKDGDFAIWSAHPLSIHAIAEQTFVEGVEYFNRAEDENDQRLTISPEDNYGQRLAGRVEDACMQGTFHLFTDGELKAIEALRNEFMQGGK